MDTSLAVSKKEVALGLLRNGGLLVHLDPRGEDVWVPFRFKHLSELVLPIGLRSDHTQDLRIDDEGVSGTFRFRKMAWECRLPWRAIFALADATGQGSIWPLEVPEELKGRDVIEPGPLAIPAPNRTYLVINGRAITGEAWSMLATDGERIPGVKWIDHAGLRARIGGDVDAIGRHFAEKRGASDPRHTPRFSMFLGYMAGKQTCEVSWNDCVIRTEFDDFIEIRAREYYELRVGPGAGLLPYIKEWIARLKKLFRRR